MKSTLDPTLQGSTRKYYDAINANKKDVVLPAKENTYGNIEGLMNHFKLVMYGHGIRPPSERCICLWKGPMESWDFILFPTAVTSPGGSAFIRRVLRSWPRCLNV